MCAHFGWWKPAIPRSVNRTRLLRHLARKAQVHGNKGFGISTKLGQEDAPIRYTGSASQWLQQNNNELKKLAAQDVLLGHTRWPSQGDVSKANTHPFQIGQWVCAHNGTIRNSAELLESALYVPFGETDSEEAMCYLAGHDFNAASFGSLHGTWAIVAMKRNASELIIGVDSARDFHYAKLGDGIIWATSKTTLESSLQAVGIRAEVKKLQSIRLQLPSWEEVKIEEPRVYTRLYTESKITGTDLLNSDMPTNNGSTKKRFKKRDRSATRREQYWMQTEHKSDLLDLNID
jgi:glutamine phosphoribosylpyrophosphate amidotransferase